MKITKISLRQELARAIMDIQGLDKLDISSFSDDDLIAEALLTLLRRIG